MAVQGRTVSHYFILVIRKFIDFMSLFRHSVSFSFSVNPFAPGDFAEKRVLKLVEWFSGHCCAIKS